MLFVVKWMQFEVSYIISSCFLLILTPAVLTFSAMHYFNDYSSPNHILTYKNIVFLCLLMYLYNFNISTCRQGRDHNVCVFFRLMSCLLNLLIDPRSLVSCFQWLFPFLHVNLFNNIVAFCFCITVALGCICNVNLNICSFHRPRAFIPDLR